MIGRASEFSFGWYFGIDIVSEFYLKSTQKAVIKQLSELSCFIAVISPDPDQTRKWLILIKPKHIPQTLLFNEHLLVGVY